MTGPSSKPVGRARRRRLTGLGLVVLPAAACVPPDAPTELDELAAFLFAHEGDDDDAELRAGLVNLDAWLADAEQMAATSEGYTVTNPSDEVLAVLPDAITGSEHLVGAAVGIDLRYTPDDVAPLLTTVPPDELFPDSYAFYDRTEVTDGSCWVAHDCETAAQVNHSKGKYPLGIGIEQHNEARLRWVELDGGPAIVHRTWITEPAVVTPAGLLAVPNQVYLNVVLPRGDDGHRRLQATWIDARILGDAPIAPGLALQMVLSSMRSGATAVEGWYDAQAGGS